MLEGVATLPNEVDSNLEVLSYKATTLIKVIHFY